MGWGLRGGSGLDRGRVVQVRGVWAAKTGERSMGRPPGGATLVKQEPHVAGHPADAACALSPTETMLRYSTCGHIAPIT